MLRARHAQDRPHRHGILGLQLQQVERVRDPDDLVERAVVHRITTVPGLGEHVRRLRSRHPFEDRHDRRAWGHELAHRPIGERQHSGDDLDLVRRGQRVGAGAR